MKSKKATKRALLSSALSLVLCFSMLLGTTFAWFTDSASTGVNRIESGTLKVDIVDVENNSLDKQTMSFMNVSGKTNILWEPGVTFLTQGFKIVNKGNLALKYKLVINGIDGDNDLLDVIDFWLISPETKPAKVEELEGMTRVDLDEEFNLDPAGKTLINAGKNESDVYYLVGHMDEEAGNDYQDLKLDGVGITVYATQVEAEVDSFDQYYDINATYEPWAGDVASAAELFSLFDEETNTLTISTAAQLAAFAAHVNGTLKDDGTTATFSADSTLEAENYDGITVKLAADINLNNMPWTPIGKGGAGFYGDFDGQGNTVYNLKVKNESYAGLFGLVFTGSVSNVNVVNADIKTSHYAGAIAGQGYAQIKNCHVENVNIVNTVVNSDNGDKTGGIIGQNCEGTLSVTDCSVTNATLRGYRDIGGIVGMAHNNNKVTGNTATNVKIIVDASNNYNNIAYLNDYNAGKIIGRYGTSVTDTNNVSTDVTIRYIVPATGSKEVDANTVEVNAEVQKDAENTSKVATFTIPGAALEDGVTEVTVSVVETEQDASVTVDSDQSAITYEVTVSGIKEDNEEPIKVEMQVGTGLTGVKVYHKDSEVTPITYSSETGWVIFETTSFSPYTVVYDTVAAEEETPVIPDPNPDTGLPEGIPVAVVTDADQFENVAIEWKSAGGIPAYDANQRLESAYIFKAPHNSTTIADCVYKDWYCDYYVKLDRNLAASSIFLAGNYGPFDWIGFDNGELTLEANTEIPLLGSVTENPWTYESVVNFVEEFTCGVAHLNDSLDGATFTVMLRLTNPADETEYYNVNTVEYIFGNYTAE